MKLRRRFTSSLQPLVVHRVRAGLALSGVAVGVAAVIVSRAIGIGAQREMTQTIERTGTNLLIIKPQPVRRLVMRPQITGFATTLTVQDYEAIAEMPRVAKAAPGIEGTMRVKAGNMATKTTVRGTTPAYLSVRRFQMAEGRCFDEDDNRDLRRVAVLGARVSEALTDGRSPIGQEIKIRSVPFQVIGVLKAKGTTADGADQDDQILIPVRTALRRVFNETWLTSVYASIVEPSRMEEAKAQIEELLRQRHQRGGERGPDDFGVQDTTKTRAFQQEMLVSLSRYATGLAVIALVVGGIGIMALMLMSVRERTSEIGLRMAVGAQPRDVLFQFLIEATILAVAGWAAGALLGGGATGAIAWGTSWAVATPVTTIGQSLAVAVVLGLGFGALPARNAAQIPPIEALRRA